MLETAKRSPVSNGLDDARFSPFSVACCLRHRFQTMDRNRKSHNVQTSTQWDDEKKKNSYTISPALSCLQHFLDTVLGVKVLVTRNTLVWLSLQSGSCKNTPEERVSSTFTYGNLLAGFLSGLSQVSPGFWGERRA